MDIAQLFRYLFTLHSLTIYPLFPLAPPLADDAWSFCCHYLQSYCSFSNFKVFQM